jgi:DNA-binding NarL/FixJ family response regulator
MIGAAPTTAYKSSILAVDPDVVLVDVGHRDPSGLDLVSQLIATSPHVRVVVFTKDADEHQVVEALRRGASGYLLQSMSSDALADCLVRAAEGETVVDAGIATRNVTRAARQRTEPTWADARIGLSQRESEVLELLVDGRSNAQIAAELVVGTETVKTHLRSIYRKLEVRGRAQAVATSLRQGLFADRVAGHPFVASTGRLEPATDGSEAADGQRQRLANRAG